MNIKLYEVNLFVAGGALINAIYCESSFSCVFNMILCILNLTVYYFNSREAQSDEPNSL